MNFIVDEKFIVLVSVVKDSSVFSKKHLKCKTIYFCTLKLVSHKIATISMLWLLNKEAFCESCSCYVIIL